MAFNFSPPISTKTLHLSNEEDLGKHRLTAARHFEFVQTQGTITYDGFFQEFLLPNKPCVLSSDVTETWRSRKEWVKENGRPDIEYLMKNFGGAVVPVADCKAEEFGSHCKTEMKMCNYLKYWTDYMEAEHPETMPCLYLKDWHFTRAFPTYKAYTTPEYFRSDWLNEFWDIRNDVDDDYRFVYMGPKGTWTPFHADVFRSFSWSANICGRKRWIFVPPGEEEAYKDKFGQLVYDVNSDDLNNSSMYPKYSNAKQRLEVIQGPGETIFVPSGWHHQVFNLEDTISINHNWLNGCNVDICWNFLKQNLQDVQREISDCQDMEGWHEQCQLVLKASSGIDFREFYRFMLTIANNRLLFIKSLSNGVESTSHHSCQSDGMESWECSIEQTTTEKLSTDQSGTVRNKTDQSDAVRQNADQSDSVRYKTEQSDTMTYNTDKLVTENRDACAGTQEETFYDVEDNMSDVKENKSTCDRTPSKISKEEKCAASIHKSYLNKNEGYKPDVDTNIDLFNNMAVQNLKIDANRCFPELLNSGIIPPASIDGPDNIETDENATRGDDKNTSREIQWRRNHSQFDLCRILNVLQDMVQSSEFCSLDLESSEFTDLSENLIEKIQTAIEK